MVKILLLQKNKEGLVQGNPVQQELDFDLIHPLTLEQCHEIVALLCQVLQDEKPECIGIDLGNGQIATHNVAENCLRVWKGDCPIYENLDGIICENTVTIIEHLMH